MITVKLSLFPKRGRWLRGNLHTHTTRSDGLCPPQQQIDDYRSEGYDFLSITDHNVMDSHNLNAGENFCLLPGWERDINYSYAKCIHLVGISSKEPKDQPTVIAKRCVPGEIEDQELLDEMLSQGQFVVLAHPIWSRMEPAEVEQLQGFHAIEVFNTICERKCHTGHAEVYWDLLLQKGRRVFGVASDDTHGKTKKSDRFGGWVMVKAETCTHKDITDSLRAGNFYSSMGPEIYDWGIDEGDIYIKCSPCDEIHFITYPRRGSSHYHEDGPLTGAEHKLSGNEDYVRVECIDSEGNVAWTNAVFLKDYR